MEIASIIIRQTLVMFLYMAAGFVLFKSGKISAAGSRDLAALLLWLVIPVVLIRSFCVEYTPQRLMTLFASSALGILALGIAILVARLIFPRRPIDNFAAAFSNAAFMGIPLVKACLGDEAVFCLAGIIAALNILQWTYGVAVLTGKKVASGFQGLLKNPILLGTVLGLILFFTGQGPNLPDVVSGTLQGIAALNAPLAMLVLGVYLAQTSVRAMLMSTKVYWVSAVRLLVIPLLTLLVFLPLPVAPETKLAVLIAAAAPVGANVAVYAQLNGQDYPYACQTVALSTVLSVATLPLVLLIASCIF